MSLQGTYYPRCAAAHRVQIGTKTPPPCRRPTDDSALSAAGHHARCRQTHTGLASVRAYRVTLTNHVVKNRIFDIKCTNNFSLGSGGNALRLVTS